MEADVIVVVIIDVVIVTVIVPFISSHNTH